MDISEGAWIDPNHSPSLGTPSLSQQSPDYGLLTRTLIHSPVVKKILPARIRRADLYDVVFIGESFLELHLLTESGKLQKVGSKTDFRATIRDARVFGSQRESNLSGIPRDDSMNGVHHEDRALGLPPDVLVLTMDSGNLAFVYAKEAAETGEVEFVINMIRIGDKGTNPTFLGKSITVDPL
ncbi:hypothetical protein BZA77DRAFT_107589 [Pyronema omphalodes]|nr:hypothetical protein BZA77DRAFT_107589 [Pyronema omphalodes]